MVLKHCPFRHKPLCVEHSSVSDRSKKTPRYITWSLRPFLFASCGCTYRCSRCCVSSGSLGSRGSCRSPPCSYRCRCHRAVSRTHPHLEAGSIVAHLDMTVPTLVTSQRDCKVKTKWDLASYQYTWTVPVLFWSHWGRYSDSSPACQCTDRDCRYQGSLYIRYDLREERREEAKCSTQRWHWNSKDY